MLCQAELCLCQFYKVFIVLLAKIIVYQHGVFEKLVQVGVGLRTIDVKLPLLVKWLISPDEIYSMLQLIIEVPWIYFFIRVLNIDLYDLNAIGFLESFILVFQFLTNDVKEISSVKRFNRAALDLERMYYERIFRLDGLVKIHFIIKISYRK